MNTDYFQILIAAAPQAILTLAALAALVADAAFMRGLPIRERCFVSSATGAFGLIVALGFLLAMPMDVALADGMLIADPLTRIVQATILVLALLTLALSLQSKFTDHAGEFVALILLSTIGLMFLASASNILMIFVSLELASLSLYILTAFNKNNPNSTEAALKYFLFGGVSAAFTLFGLSWIYGLTGATDLAGIASALQGQTMEPMLMAAMILTLTGFGFKIAAVPFHLWAPDAYEGAPAPAAAFIASASKVASFFILAKIVIIGLAGFGGNVAWGHFASGWLPLIAMLAVFSILLGNLAAIAQRNVRRLLAYSAIAHAGYVLLGVLAGNAMGVASLVYYVATYGLTVIGAFAVVAVVEDEHGDAAMGNFAGLSRRSPLLAICMMVFLLSLAGIPPLAGFFGKFYVFAAAIKSEPTHLGLLWLVIFAIAMSAVSLYYYLQVLKQIFVVETPDAPVIAVPLAYCLTLIVIVLGVIILGAFPNLLVGPIAAAVKAAGF